MLTSLLVTAAIMGTITVPGLIGMHLEDKKKAQAE